MTAAAIQRPEPGERMLPFFKYDHLPEPLQNVSAPFGVLAGVIVDTLPAGPERTVCLRKLLEAKDCAVRAVLEARREQPLGTPFPESLR